MRKAWKWQLFEQFSRMERPKVQEKLENGKTPHWNDGNCNFFSNLAEAAQSKGKSWKLQRNPLKGWKWQKPPKAKENLENCRENKPCAICLYVVTCSNSAGNLGNGRKKLGLVPLAQWNHKIEAFLQWEKHGNCNFLSSFPDGAPQSKGKTRKRQRNPLKGWKLQLFQQFGRSRPKQRKTFKIAEKISYVPSACM